MKYKLIERLREYYKLEGFHVIWISLFCLFLNVKFGWVESILLSYGMFIVVFILIQGTYYWKIKLRRLQGKHLYEKRILNFFKIFRLLNLIFILSFPVLLSVLYYKNLLVLQMNKNWAVFAYIFGFAEYVNYYHIQLMYDNKNDWQYLRTYRRLKIASLRKDLAENKI